MDDGYVHEKRYIILHMDDDTVTTCVINSQISQFVRSRSTLLKCQVEMDANTHAFMDRTSHVDCSRTWVYSTDSVVEELVGRTDWILGTITAGLRDHLVAAFKFAQTLSSTDVNTIAEALRLI